MKKIIFILLTFLNGIIFSQVPERPRPQKLYNNLSSEYPDFLSSQEAQQLETKLENFSNETSNQICVVITDDLNGLSDEQYATAIGQEWGVGKKDKNNGIVILIKPTGGQGNRALFIAVGYGLEGAIPDLTTKKIREDLMYPYLKNKENFKALDGAVTDLMRLAKGEINAKDYSPSRLSSKNIFNIIIIVIFVIFFLYIFFGKGGGGNGGHTYYGGSTGGWTSSSRSSSSGSSWGGFGGGSFGGGGSGGNW
jgi:uncharacterized protein